MSTIEPCYLLCILVHSSMTANTLPDVVVFIRVVRTSRPGTNCDHADGSHLLLQIRVKEYTLILIPDKSAH